MLTLPKRRWLSFVSHTNSYNSFRKINTTTKDNKDIILPLGSIHGLLNNQPYVIILFATIIIVFIKQLATKHGRHNNTIIHALLLMALIIIPGFAQVYHFQTHSLIHDFSTLKFSLPLSALPFALIPLMLFAQFGQQGLVNRHKSAILPALFFTIISFSYAYVEYPNFINMYPTPDPSIKEIGTFVKQNAAYNHVVFSPDGRIDELPPQYLSQSMKRVYPSSSYNDIRNWLSNNQLCGDYRIAILFLKPPAPEWLNSLSYTLTKHNQKDYYYMVIDPSSWPPVPCAN